MKLNILLKQVRHSRKKSSIDSTTASTSQISSSDVSSNSSLANNNEDVQPIASHNPTVRAVSLFNGSFHGDNVMIGMTAGDTDADTDEYRERSLTTNDLSKKPSTVPSPASLPRTRFHETDLTRVKKFLQVVHNDDEYNCNCDDRKEPNDTVLQNMMDSLSEQEKETAARCLYTYAMIKDSEANCCSHQKESSSSCSLTAETTNKKIIDDLRRRAIFLMARRYYIAEDGLLQNATDKMKATIAYRQERNVDGIRTCFYDTTPEAIETRGKIQKYLGNGRMFVRGYDTAGHAVLHFIVNNSPVSSKNDPDGCIESFCYILERAIACTERHTSGRKTHFVVSVDFTKFASWHAPPLPVVQQMAVMLRGHFPERLLRVYLVNAPLLFRTLWALIKPFLDPVTKEKFFFVSGDAQRQAVFGTSFSAEQCLPYQRSDGAMVDDIDMDQFYHMPFDQAYGETTQASAETSMN